ncbi:MAG: hypothetical protein PHT12_01820 [Patescibacteria group bacterium]|nr:hypothetical protein [Patescibacteria group bacterium]
METDKPFITEKTSTAGQGQGAFLRNPPEEVHVVVSDLHMSEGVLRPIACATSPWGRLMEKVKCYIFGRETNPCVNPNNPLEDFPDDGIFVKFLNRIAERYETAGQLVLRFLGDTFDSLVVTWEGDYVEPPFEQAALVKMEKIIAGHPAFFDAVAEFLREPKRRVDFFVGNHDLILAWPAVQRCLIGRIAGEDDDIAARIRFVDQHQGFMDFHRGVLYSHGMESQVQNSPRPENTIVTHRFGRPLRLPVLNIPFGSRVYASVINRIKMNNPLVGRLTNYRDFVAEAALRRWGWTLYTACIVSSGYVKQLFFRDPSAQRGIGLSLLANTITQALTCDVVEVDRYAARLLGERPEVKAVLLGHSHNWRRVSGSHGTYINTGTWMMLFGLEYPKMELIWGRFRFVEQAWRKTQRFFRAHEVPRSIQLSYILFWVAFVVAAGFLIHFGVLELPAVILMVLLILAAFISLFVTKPNVVPLRRLTFALVKHFTDGGLRVSLREFVSETGEIREVV